MYNITPAFAVSRIASPTWTAEKVDTDTTVILAPQADFTARSTVDDQSWVKGDSRYIGAEMDLGLTWEVCAEHRVRSPGRVSQGGARARHGRGAQRSAHASERERWLYAGGARAASLLAVRALPVGWLGRLEARLSGLARARFGRPSRSRCPESARSRPAAVIVNTHGHRGRDRASAPRERLGEDRQEHAVGRERRRDSIGDREERGADQQATRGRTHPETSITCNLLLGIAILAPLLFGLLLGLAAPVARLLPGRHRDSDARSAGRQHQPLD